MAKDHQIDRLVTVTILEQIPRPYSCGWFECPNADHVYENIIDFRKHLYTHFFFDEPVFQKSISSKVDSAWGHCTCGFSGPAIHWVGHIYDNCCFYQLW